MSNEVRERLGGMMDETSGERSGHTDDGWALVQASRRLDNVKAKNKIIIMCCDGSSNQSMPHNHEEFRLDNAIREITQKPDQVLVALGIGPNTQQVVDHYPSGVGNIKAEELPTRLARVLEKVIAEYEKFRR
jgi:cobalamin biosynthesis protein CobT